jgi:ubiquinone/menaquinone biosynthesis C-methylase UbiE
MLISHGFASEVILKLGDFTALAKNFTHRVGYSSAVLAALAAHTGVDPAFSVIADVGAGTGKLTEGLIALGLSGVAVEPNDAMRRAGLERLGDAPFTWRVGRAEALELPNNSVDWVLMGSAFHWTHAQQALSEFYRVLKPGGHFTALWNPRDLDRSELNRRIDEKIRAIVPNLQRVSSGSREYTEVLEDLLLSSGEFQDLIFIEAPHPEPFTAERYLGVWRSVNDIRAQAGPERFAAVMEMIAAEIAGLERISIPYRTRAWTVKSSKAP